MILSPTHHCKPPNGILQHIIPFTRLEMGEGRQIYQFSTRIIGFTQCWLIDRMVELDKSRHLLLLLSLVKLICGVLAAFSFNLTKHIRWAVIQVIGFVYCVRDRRRVCFLSSALCKVSRRVWVEPPWVTEGQHQVSLLLELRNKIWKMNARAQN